MKVTIIIPVYKVEKYILRCLESVAKQTYKDIEIILVDDCGGDNSIALADEFLSNTKIDYKIIHHKKNSGLSAARNSGIKVAQGEYMYFLDSDDTISEDCIEDLVRKTISLNPDMAIAGIIAIDIFGNQSKYAVYENRQALNQKEVIQLYLEDRLAWNAVSRLIRRSFLVDNNLYFDEGITSEDFIWNFRLLPHINSVAVSDAASYFYYYNPTSIMGTSRSNQKYTEDLITIAKLLADSAYASNSSAYFSYFIKLKYSFIPYSILWHNFKSKECRKYLIRLFSGAPKTERKRLSILKRTLLNCSAGNLAWYYEKKFLAKEYFSVFKAKTSKLLKRKH